MQRIIYLLFLSIFLLGYLEKIKLIPRVLTYVPEILSASIFVFVIIQGAIRRTIGIRIGYWILFLIFAMEVLSGAIMNGVPSGAMFAGIRSYFKYVPFLLLPVVYRFTEQELRKQMLLLLALSFLQAPISLYQRLFQFSGILTGDVVTGTLDSSGILSVYLICATGVVFGCFLKNIISRNMLILSLLILIIPTTINETKATLFILPIALFMPALAIDDPVQRKKTLGMAFILGALFLVIFVPIYDYFIIDRYGYGLFEFLTMEGRVMGYLAPGLSSGDVTEVGRIDSIVLFFKDLSDDPTKLLLGLGMGNISPSFLGSRFSGEYLEKYGEYALSSLSLLLWEIGILGILLILVFFYMIFRDALLVRKRKDAIAAIALGWTGVIVLMLFALFYSKVIPSNTVSYLFWYFTGHILVVAKQMRDERVVSNVSFVRLKNNVLDTIVK